MRFSQILFVQCLHLLHTSGVIVLCHHLGEVDSAEILHETFGWKQGRVLENVQRIGLFFPAHEVDRFLGCVKAFVEEGDREHLLAKVELLA